MEGELVAVVEVVATETPIELVALPIPEIAGEIHEEKPKPEESIRDEKGRIKPGFSLNPDGKPRGIKHFKTIYMDVMKEIGAKNQKGEDIANDLVIVKKLYDKAKNGDLKAIEMIVSRVDGDREDAPPLLQVNVIALTQEQQTALEALL